MGRVAPAQQDRLSAILYLGGNFSGSVGKLPVDKDQQLIQRRLSGAVINCGHFLAAFCCFFCSRSTASFSRR
jgi:hypothetical protein